MKNTGTLKVTTASDREIIMTRVFDAPAETYDRLPEMLASDASSREVA